MKLTPSFFLLCFVLSLPLIGQETLPQQTEDDRALFLSRELKFFDTVVSADLRGSMSLLRITEPMDREPRDYQDFVGVSDDQIDQIYDRHLQQIEECKTALSQLVKEKALPPDEQAKREDQHFAMFSKLFEDIEHSFVETLTPDQRQRNHELQLAIPPMSAAILDYPAENTCVNFAGYNALDLTQEQQKALEKVRKETEPEYKKLLKEAREKMLKKEEQSESFKKIIEKLQQLTSRTKAHVLAFLTKEQKAKMEKILKDVPEKLAKIEKDREEKAKKEPESWKPNEKSWKPGDGVPEEFESPIPQNGKRFPRLL